MLRFFQREKNICEKVVIAQTNTELLGLVLTSLDISVGSMNLLMEMGSLQVIVVGLPW